MDRREKTRKQTWKQNINRHNGHYQEKRKGYRVKKHPYVAFLSQRSRLPVGPPTWESLPIDTNFDTDARIGRSPPGDFFLYRSASLFHHLAAIHLPNTHHFFPVFPPKPTRQEGNSPKTLALARLYCRNSGNVEAVDRPRDQSLNLSRFRVLWNMLVHRHEAEVGRDCMQYEQRAKEKGNDMPSAKSSNREI